MIPSDDHDLVKAFQDGDERAFNELVRRYQEKIYWVARRFAGDHDDADDIVQETFIKVYRGLGEFRGDANFFTWIYRIAVNTSLNAVRRTRLRKFLSIDDAGETAAGAEGSPDAILEQEEHRRLVDEAIASLPEKQKAVFVLRYFDELPYEELSAILNTSVGGLKANYFHAARKVAAYVQHAHKTH